MANEKCKVCQRELVLDEENLCSYCELTQERNTVNEVTQDRTAMYIPLNVNCGICEVIVEEDSEGLFCDVCNSWFHNNCIKTSLDYELYALLNEAPDNVKWFCDKCIWETEKWIKGVNKNYQISGKDGDLKKKITKLKSKENAKVSDKTNEEVDLETNVAIKEEVNEDVNEEVEDLHEEDEYVHEEDEDEDYIPAIPEIIIEEYETMKIHSCKACDYKTNRKDHLQGHIKTHFNEKEPKKISLKNHSCKECDYETDRRDHIQRHMKTHSNEIHSCKECDYKTNNKDYLQRHIKTHFDEKEPKKKSLEIHSCKECDYKTNKKYDLQRHLKTHFKEKELKNVKDESLDSTERDLLEKEEIIKRKSDKYVTEDVLSIIDISPERLSSIADGITSIKKSLRIRYKCNLCMRDFENPEGCIAHKLRDHEGVQKPYKCSVSKCDFKANYKSELNQHIETHSDEEKLTCHICGKMLKNRLVLQRHLKFLHSNENIELISCTECDYKTKNPNNLKRHMQTHLSKEERSHACDLCDARFNKLNRLKIHKAIHARKSGELNENIDNEDDEMKNSELNENKDNAKDKVKTLDTNPYICDFCDRGFKTPQFLKIHRMSHTGERPFKCEICGKGMKSQGHLNWHVKESHNKSIVTCEICGFGAPTIGRLNAHTKYVHGKTIECDMCGKMFSFQYQLAAHKSDDGFGKLGYGLCKGSKTQENSGFEEVRQMKEIKTNDGRTRIFFECDKCFKICPTKQKFAKHKCRDHIYTVECDKCGRKCRNEEFLRKKHKCIIVPRDKLRPHKFPKKKKVISGSPKKKKLKKESNASHNTYSANNESSNQDDSSHPIQETSSAREPRMFTAQHLGYQQSTEPRLVPTMQPHHDYQPSIDHIPSIQNHDNQMSTNHIPTMQNQPPLLLYANRPNNNVFAALIPPNPRSISAAFNPTSINYSNNQWS